MASIEPKSAESRAVIVTGASQGIGLSIALKFLSEGCRVVLVSRNIKKARGRLPPECLDGAAGPHGRAYLVSKDLTEPDACKECVTEAMALLGGKLDVLVNNAGSGALKQNLETTTPDDWDTAFNLNLKCYGLMMQAALPYLEVGGGGAVVNISGVAAQRPFTSMLPYCCAKAGVDMLTKCTALELAPKKIRVNSVAPGTIDTEFLAAAGLEAEGQLDRFLSESEAVHPIGRIGTPTDVAEAVFFLASPSSGFVTGQSLMLDGGRTLTLPSGKALKTT